MSAVAARPTRPVGAAVQRVPSSEPRTPCVTAGELDTRQIRGKPALSDLINEYERAA
jgi:hypothetical protein